MKDATAVARWYRRIDPRCFTTQRSTYTGEEVRRLIDPSNHEETERETAVLTVATAPNDWLPLVDDRRRRTLGAIADRLPSLVSLYRSGASLDEMRDRFGGWSTWRYERALEIACDSIARRLNRGQLSG